MLWILWYSRKVVEKTRKKKKTWKSKVSFQVNAITMMHFSGKNKTFLNHCWIELSFRMIDQRKCVKSFFQPRPLQFLLWKQSLEVFYRKGCSYKVSKIYRKTPVPGSLLIKIKDWGQQLYYIISKKENIKMKKKARKASCK